MTGTRRAALYARVSTADKNQQPESQLEPMRAFAATKGWTVVDEFVDKAPAGDLRRRKEWRRFWADARRRRFDVLLIWHTDRATRDTADGLAMLALLEKAGVDFVSLTQSDLDTTTPFGRLVFTISAALAEMETNRLSERVKAGMAHARNKGIRLGRPAVTSRPGFAARWAKVEPEVVAGRLSRRAAATKLRVGQATIRRLLAET